MADTKIFDDENAKSFLQKYLNNASPSGFEEDGQRIWIDYISQYVDDIIIDNYGTVVGVINPEAEFKVMIEAHADEIAWTVKNIATGGFINVEKLGGSDPQVAPGQRVNIHTKDGIVKGAFGWTAIHIRDKEKKPLASNLFVDVGAINSKRVAELGIEIGDPITFDVDMDIIGGNKIVSRGLDNRIGGFAIAQVAKLIRENNIDLPFGLYITNSVQEEVGKNGAKMICDTIKPDVAIVTDVTHDTSTPGIPVTTKGDLKITRGPVITSAPMIQKKLLNLVKTIAAKNEIKYQMKTANKITGTDADMVSISNGGTPTALISLPIRYMHTPNELCSVTDLEGMIKLIFKTLKKIKPDMKFTNLTK